MQLEELLRRANQKLTVPGMHPSVVRIARDVIQELYPHGIKLGIAQSFRSIAEQNALYAKGRTTQGPIVTQARGGQSNHNFGVAIDVFLYEDGALFLSPPDARLRRIVAAMKRRGMDWGGDWSRFPDYPHFELYDHVSLARHHVPKPGHYLRERIQAPELVRAIEKRLGLMVTGIFDIRLT
ncbi:MAG: M15 family metallopeptidase, partial [Exiguobacterium sp.]